MGPTAVGKTALALALVQRFPCDIISVDSAMIYRGMDIGTAKPDAETLRVAPHRLIDIRDPAQRYSAARFAADARREMEAITRAGRIPLLVGGTMLYFRALERGLAPLPTADETVRARLAAEAAEVGWEALHRRLRDVDPQAAGRIHPNDPQRIQRALEVFALSGRTLTELCAHSAQAPLPFQVAKLALIPGERHILRARIAQRFQAMMAQGLLEEVRGLYHRGDLHPGLPAIRCVGYRQLWRHLAGDSSREEAVAGAVIATRQLAKRQLTWLRRERGLHHFDSADPALAERVAACLGKIL